jgi:hypothetical protein
VTEEPKVKKIAKAEKLDKIFANWKPTSNPDIMEASYEIGRLVFHKMPPEVTVVISKKHCVLYAKRVRKIIEETKLEDPFIAETLCMLDLMSNLPKPKKNPSIMINGEKVVDSDIEEKKEHKYRGTA